VLTSGNEIYTPSAIDDFAAAAVPESGAHYDSPCKGRALTKQKHAQTAATDDHNKEMAVV